MNTLNKIENILAIDIGGTSIKYGIVSKEYRILSSHEMPSDGAKGGEYIVSHIKDIVEKYRDQVSHVSIATAGMVNPETGEIIFAGSQIPRYIGVNLKQIIEERYGLPTKVDNDVKCAGLSEFMLGAGKDAKSALILTVGTGIGGSYFSRNEDGTVHVLRGASYAALEVGYLSLGSRTFQQSASTTALVARAKETLGEDLTGRMIFERIRNGDTALTDVLHETLDALAKGIASICYVLNPETVILGGGIMAQREIIEPILKRYLQTHLLESILQHTDIRFAHFNNQAGMLGAALRV